MRIGQIAIVAAIALILGGGAALAQGVKPDTQQDVQHDTQTKPDQPQDLSGSKGQNPQAQNPQARSGVEDPVNAMLGAWEFSDADHNRICSFNFRGEAASGGRGVGFDQDCSKPFSCPKN